MAGVGFVVPRSLLLWLAEAMAGIGDTEVRKIQQCVPWPKPTTLMRKRALNAETLHCRVGTQKDNCFRQAWAWTATNANRHMQLQCIRLFMMAHVFFGALFYNTRFACCTPVWCPEIGVVNLFVAIMNWEPPTVRVPVMC